MNLMPLVSSNLWAARIRPRLPSLIRSARDTPWFWYFLATDTTKRRLLRTSLSSASPSPTRILCARLTSSSCGISGYLLISRKYWSSEPSSNEGARLPGPTCIGRMRGTLLPLSVRRNGDFVVSHESRVASVGRVTPVTQDALQPTLTSLPAVPDSAPAFILTRDLCLHIIGVDLGP